MFVSFLDDKCVLTEHTIINLVNITVKIYFIYSITVYHSFHFIMTESFKKSSQSLTKKQSNYLFVLTE